MKIYTGGGDDGSTGLYYGGRVPKSAAGPEAYGTVDETVAALGVARSLADPETAARLIDLQRQLFVVGAELATDPANRHKLSEGVSLVTTAMVTALEQRIDRIVEESGMPTEFVVPGGNALAAALDNARAVGRRAERRAVAAVTGDSQVVPYLNRLADLLYMEARAAESEWQPVRTEEDQ
ncbi:MAG: cob(I)yrinic acid a,c-diamide adenosyltransferase [Acidimicrobiia bacterium]